MKVSVTNKWKVKPPKRGTPGSAGLDISIPDEFNQAFVSEFSTNNRNPSSDCFIDAPKGQINIHPFGKVYIPTGIKMEVPEGTMLLVENKSGVSWNDRVTRLACVVDYDYQGYLVITMVNHSKNNTVLMAGQKITQLICVPILYPTVDIVDEEEIHQKPSERRDGSFGSTGK